MRVDEMSLLKKKAMICCFGVILIIGFVIAYFAAQDSYDGEMPLVEIQYEDVSGQIKSKNIGLHGCDWTYEESAEQEAFTEKIEYHLTDSNVKLIEAQVNVNTVIHVYIAYKEKPSRIVIKSFDENTVEDYTKGKIVAENETSIVGVPGQIYAIELEFRENRVMYAFKCT